MLLLIAVVACKRARPPAVMTRTERPRWGAAGGIRPERAVIQELVRLVGCGRLDLAPSITAHIALAQATEAIHRLQHMIGNPIRLILTP